MADNYTDFGVIGDLSSAQQGGLFDVSLDYVSTAHFGVTITNGASLDKIDLTSSQFVVTTSPSLQIQLTFSAIDNYDSLAAIDMVRVYRTTPTTVAERTFVDGSVLKASDINTQNKQLLLGIQERGKGDITIDTDGKLDAASNLAGVATQIKNVALPENDSEVATKEYVDNAAVYGSAFGAGDPQYWTFTTAAADISDTTPANRVYTLAAPDPASTSSNMFLVEAGGVLQDPETYTVTLVSGVYYLTLVGGATNISETGVEIIARNFGAARNIISQPYQHADDLTTTVALQVRRLSASTEGSLQEWQDESGDTLAYFNNVGSLRIGKGGIDDPNILISSGWALDGTHDDSDTQVTGLGIEIGNFTADNTAGIHLGRYESDDAANQFSRIRISGKSGANAASTCIAQYHGTDMVFKTTVGGAITAAGQLTADSIRIPPTAGDPGIRSTEEATNPGVIYFSTTGPLMHYDDNHYIQSKSYTVYVKGPLETSAGGLTVDGGITVNPAEEDNGTISLKGAGRIFTPAYSYTGLQLGENGPALMFDSANYLTVTTDSVYIYGDTVIRGNGGLNMGKVLDGTEEALLEHGQIKNMAEPTVASDAATKNYVDTGNANAGSVVVGEAKRTYLLYYDTDVTQGTDTLELTLPAGFAWTDFKDFELNIGGIRHYEGSSNDINNPREWEMQLKQDTTWAKYGTFWKSVSYTNGHDNQSTYTFTLKGLNPDVVSMGSDGDALFKEPRFRVHTFGYYQGYAGGSESVTTDSTSAERFLFDSGNIIKPLAGIRLEPATSGNASYRIYIQEISLYGTTK